GARAPQTRGHDGAIEKGRLTAHQPDASARGNAEPSLTRRLRMRTYGRCLLRLGHAGRVGWKAAFASAHVGEPLRPARLTVTTAVAKRHGAFRADGLLAPLFSRREIPAARWTAAARRTRRICGFDNRVTAGALDEFHGPLRYSRLSTIRIRFDAGAVANSVGRSLPIMRTQKRRSLPCQS